MCVSFPYWPYRVMWTIWLQGLVTCLFPLTAPWRVKSLCCPVGMICFTSTLRNRGCVRVLKNVLLSGMWKFAHICRGGIMRYVFALPVWQTHWPWHEYKVCEYIEQLGRYWQIYSEALLCNQGSDDSETEVTWNFSIWFSGSYFEYFTSWALY